VTADARTGAVAGTRSATARWLTAFGVAVLVGQHLGALPGGLGDAGGGTRWVDWLDLLTPYAVVGSALAVLAAAGASRRGWLLAGVGAIAYVQGHGIHLAANSVGNARGDGAPVHLWDEVVGHLIWYAGLALLVVALVPVVRRAGVPTRPLGLLLAAGVGLTWATNGLEGGTAVGSLAVAVALSAWGWRLRNEGAGRLLLAAFPLAVVVLAGWGALQGGFPQPSELGRE
jgi:hypothetical protein